MSEHIIDATHQMPPDPFQIMHQQPQPLRANNPIDFAQAVDMQNPPIELLNARIQPTHLSAEGHIAINIVALSQIEDLDMVQREADTNDDSCRVTLGASMIVGSMTLAILSMSPQVIVITTACLLKGTLLTTHRPTFSAKSLNYKRLLNLACVANSFGIGVLYNQGFKDGAIFLGAINVLAGLAGMAVIQSCCPQAQNAAHI